MDFLIFGPQNWVWGPFFVVWMAQSVSESFINPKYKKKLDFSPCLEYLFVVLGYFKLFIDFLTIFMKSGMSFCGIWAKFQLKRVILDKFRENIFPD